MSCYLKKLKLIVSVSVIVTTVSVTVVVLLLLAVSVTVIVLLLLAVSVTVVVSVTVIVLLLLAVSVTVVVSVTVIVLLLAVSVTVTLLTVTVFMPMFTLCLFGVSVRVRVGMVRSIARNAVVRVPVFRFVVLHLGLLFHHDFTIVRHVCHNLRNQFVLGRRRTVSRLDERHRDGFARRRRSKRHVPGRPVDGDGHARRESARHDVHVRRPRGNLDHVSSLSAPARETRRTPRGELDETRRFRIPNRDVSFIIQRSSGVHL